MRTKDYTKIMGLALFLTVCTSGAEQLDDSDAHTPLTYTEQRSVPPAPTPPGFKVAYVGDQGSTTESVKVLELIKSEKTDLFILAGDFDYKDDPLRWEKMMRKTIGDMPVLAVIGNHDVKKWKDYARLLTKRLIAMPKARCWGEIGVKQRCEYEGLVFALSGVGTRGSDHETFLDKALTESPAIFKICVWHKNQRLMQVGTKGDEVGWGPYETCRREGAMVATGHEHSYERSYLMSSFEHQTVVHRSDELQLEKGKSLAFVSGLGGKSIRDENLPSPWWAKVYTKKQNAEHGVLFCSYNVDGDPRKASCYFKNIKGEIIDKFTIKSALPAA